jgi:DEAD/DEAH box helicase domain-containing protein
VDPRAFLASVAGDESLAHVRELPARPTALQPFPDDLPEVVVGRLEMLGVEGLYRHQRMALDAVRGGGNVIMATGTACG